MCGFAAFFQTGHTFSNDVLSSVDQDLYHRGPDSGGIISEPGVALVFRRLSILDPSHSSDQPMTDSTGRYTIVFNGEIYNYLEVKNELIKSGVKFRSSGDTEVLLQGYITWGEKLLDKIHGMYAFVIVDRHNKQAIAARDPIGIKPLYLLNQNGFIGVSSEIKPLFHFTEPKVDVSALSELLTFTWAGGSMSNYDGIDRILPGTLLKVSLTDNSVKERRFFDILNTIHTDHSLFSNELEEDIHSSINDSVIAHLASDVGYTIQLSGGVDSSLVTAMVSEYTNEKLDSYSVSLGDNQYDEGQYRKEVVSKYGLEHHEVYMDGKDFADALPRAVKHMEGPVPHGGCVMLMLLCDQIAKKSKVVLTGEGADEMFGGYERYSLWHKLAFQERIGSLLPSKLWPSFRPFAGIKRYSGRDTAAYACVYQNFLSTHNMFPSLIPKPGYREISASRFSDFRDRMLASDQTNYLESVLVRQDKMSMAASVESRVPFLHLPLLKLINAIPNSIRIPGGETKPVLKKIADKYLSHDLVHRRKVGLLLPYNDWLKDDKGLGRYLEMLEEPGSCLSQYSDHKTLSRSVEKFRNNKFNELPNMMNLVNIEIWLRIVSNKSINSYSG